VTVAGTQDASSPSTNGERAADAHEAPGVAADAGGGAGGGVARHVCDVAFCPIGLALSAVQPLKPDVVEHLLVAGREFLLAAKAVIDARVAEDADGGPAPTLERIDIG
jgi:hypothetical protein